MRKLLKPAVLVSSALFVFSCGGGGSEPTTTTLTGQFIDAPVAGLQYTTSSGISGITDENGHFNYRKGDTVTFKIGKIILGDAKGNDVITPTALFVDEIKNQAEIEKKVKTVVALLLTLDENPDDSKITINESVVQKLDNLTTEKNLENDDDITDISLDIDGDGQEENLGSKVKEKINEAKNHYQETLYNLLINALNNFNGKDFYFTTDNPRVKCTLQYKGGNQFSFLCINGDTDTVTIERNPLKLISLEDGIEYYVTLADKDEICVYWEEGQTMKTTCLKLWKNEKNNESNIINIVDVTDKLQGTVSNIQNPTEYKIRITPNVEQIEGEWGGVVCQINSDGSFGNQCVVHGDLANYTTDKTYQIIIFKDENNDWHFNPEEESNVLYSSSNAKFNNLTEIQIDISYAENPTPPSISNGINITSFENFLNSADNKRVLFTNVDFDEGRNYYVQKIMSCLVNVDLQNKQINLTDCSGVEKNSDISLTYEESNGTVYVDKNPLFILRDSKIACVKKSTNNDNYHLACIFNIDNPILKQPQENVKNAITGLWKRYKVYNNNEFSHLVDNGACIKFENDGKLDYITQSGAEQLEYQIESFNMTNYGNINAIKVSTPDEDITLFPLYKDASGNLIMFNIWRNKNGSLEDTDVRLFKPVNNCF